VVILIISLLAAMTLIAGGAVLKAAATSRAKTEIRAISAALENYKVDTGVYPLFDMAGPTNGTYKTDPTDPTYQLSSEALYQALAGKTNYTDALPTGVTIYYPFKSGQLGSLNNNTFIKDPFGFPYGYSTGNGTGDVPYNGIGFYDLWSTGGTTGATTANPNSTNTWLTNWKH